MSTNKKLASGPAVSDLVELVQQMDAEEAYQLHGVEIFEDGVVYDSIEDIEYTTLLDWAEAQIAEMQPKFEKRHSKRYDDNE